VAVAITAYALCDLVHEVAGHGTAALMIPDVSVVSLSTVALQTSRDSRVVAACGSIANIAFGAAALLVFPRFRRLSGTAYFCWLFASLNLLNGSGYPLYSAALGSGDWDVVIRGLRPAWMWRVALGGVGALGYVTATGLSARAAIGAVKRDLLARVEVRPLVFPAYVAGGTLLLVASAFNPISPRLIFSSGLSSGFAAMAGLTFVPGLVEAHTTDHEIGSGFVPYSTAWIATGIIVAALFVAILAPGIFMIKE
jgi:hypothetical protein